MLKKRLLQTALLSSLLLAACEDDAPESGTLEEQEETVTVEEDSTDPEEQEETDETMDEEEQADSEEQEYLYEVSENYTTINVIEGQEANEQVVLLTYDDAPDGHTLEIAEALEEHDAPAIFFVNGMYLQDEEGQEILREIHEMGFEIGNHTQTHENLTTIPEDQQYEEIIETSDLVEEITGKRPRFFRAPFGANTQFSTETALEDGMMLMNWTYGYDWEAEYQDPEALADIMVNTELLIPGANLLMHDREWTMEATPAIIEGLRDKDYELVDPVLIQSVETDELNESEETDE